MTATPDGNGRSESGSGVVDLAIGVYAAGDAGRGVGLARLIHEDCEMYFNAAGPTVGPGAIEALVTNFHAEYKRIVHTVRSAREAEAFAVLETEVAYWLHSGAEATLYGCSLMGFADGLLREWRVYADRGPLTLVRGEG